MNKYIIILLAILIPGILFAQDPLGFDKRKILRNELLSTTRKNVSDSLKGSTTLVDSIKIRNIMNGVSSDSLILFYEDDLRDLSGKGNHGTFFGTANGTALKSDTVASGRNSFLFRFTAGTDSGWIDCENPLSAGDTTKNIWGHCWVWLKTVATIYQVIIGDYDDSANNGWRLFHDPTTTIGFTVTNALNGSNIKSTRSGVFATANQWYCIDFLIYGNGTTQPRIWVNGREYYTTSNAGTTTALYMSAFTTKIGIINTASSATRYTKPLNGFVDTPRLYHRAPTADEIQIRFANERPSYFGKAQGDSINVRTIQLGNSNSKPDSAITQRQTSKAVSDSMKSIDSTKIKRGIVFTAVTSDSTGTQVGTIMFIGDTLRIKNSTGWKKLF